MKFDKYEKYGAYHWADYNRESIYKKHVDKVIKWVKGEKILDIGAGDGLITHLLGAEGVDDNKVAVKYAQQKGANVKLGSAYELEGEYDAVFLGDTLEHLEEPEKCLQAIKKVLKGNLYITIPPKGHKCKYDYHEWNATELTELVEKYGFKKIGRCQNANKRLYAKFSTYEKIKKEYRFKQPFFTVKLVNFLQRWVARFVENEELRVKLHNKIEKYRRHRCSIKHKGEYIFSAREAKKVRPSLVEEYTLEKFHYSNRKEMEEMCKKAAPYECWDSERKVFIREKKRENWLKRLYAKFAI